MTPKRGGMSVLAVSGAGPTIQVPIAADDEARAGEVVAAAAARVRRALFGTRHAQLGALVFGGAVAAFWLSFAGWVPGGGVLLLLFAAVFVLLLWRRTTIASFGAMSLAAGLSAWSQVSGHSISAVDALCVALLVVCGVGPLWIVARSTAGSRADTRLPDQGSRADTRLPDGGAWMTGLVFLIASLPATVGLLSATATGDGALFVSALSRGSGGVVFTWVAAGAALLVVPGKLRRCLAATLLVLGAGIGVARTDTWMEAVAHDPMAKGAPLPSTRRALPKPVARFSVDAAPWDLRVTHDGATVVLGSDVAAAHTHGAMHLHRFAIHPIAEPGQRTFVNGYALALGRDHRALLLAPTELGPELRWIDLSEPASVHWSHRFDVTFPGEPQLRIVGDEFVLVAESHEKRVVARGLVGGAADRITIDASPVVRGVWPLYTSEPNRLVVESSGERRGARLSLERMLWIVRPPVDLRTITWWRSDAARRLAGPSAASPWCELASDGSSSILCVAESGGSRWLWRVENDRTLVPLGRTEELGWWRWTGRRLVALGEHDLAVVDPSARREVRFTLPRATRHEVRFDASPAATVLGWPSGDGLEIEVYRGLGPS